MQMSVPELIDFQREPKHILNAYGPDTTNVGTYAYNCLLARRLAERGVRFIQLYHRGWDAHGNAPQQVRRQGSTPINPPPPCCRTSSNAVCLRIRSLSGVANSGAHRFRKVAEMDGTTTLMPVPCSLPAEA